MWFASPHDKFDSAQEFADSQRKKLDEELRLLRQFMAETWVATEKIYGYGGGGWSVGGGAASRSGSVYVADPGGYRLRYTDTDDLPDYRLVDEARMRMKTLVEENRRLRLNTNGGACA